MERLILMAQRLAVAILVPSRAVAVGGVVSFSLLFSLLSVVSASAAPVKSKVFFDAFAVEHHGTTTYALGAAVSAKEKACVAHRQVAFYKETPEAGETLVATKTASRRGVAIVLFRNADPNAIAGDYHAEVKRTRKSVGSSRVTCFAARSKTVALGPPPDQRIRDRRPMPGRA